MHNYFGNFDFQLAYLELMSCNDGASPSIIVIKEYNRNVKSREPIASKPRGRNQCRPWRVPSRRKHDTR